MAKAPEDRYASMKEFAAALIDYLKATPAAEGAGSLTAAKTGPADIFQAATVAPKRVRAAPLTARAGKAQESFEVTGGTAADAAAAGKGGGGRLWRTMPGWALGALLTLGGLGAVSSCSPG